MSPEHDQSWTVVYLRSYNQSLYNVATRFASAPPLHVVETRQQSVRQRHRAMRLVPLVPTMRLSPCLMVGKGA